MWNVPSKEQLDCIPKLYETEQVPLKDKLIYLHFFIGGCDWYIAEYDGDDLFWGYAILNDDHQCAEWGYISFAELKNIKIGWLNWYSHSGHLEKSDIENKLLEVSHDSRKKELFKAI